MKIVRMLVILKEDVSWTIHVSLCFDFPNLRENSTTLEFLFDVNHFCIVSAPSNNDLISSFPKATVTLKCI